MGSGYLRGTRFATPFNTMQGNPVTGQLKRYGRLIILAGMIAALSSNVPSVSIFIPAKADSKNL